MNHWEDTSQNTTAARQISILLDLSPSTDCEKYSIISTTCTSFRLLRMFWRQLLQLSYDLWQLDKSPKLMKKTWDWLMLSFACLENSVRYSVLGLFRCLTECTTSRSMQTSISWQQKSRDSLPSIASTATNAQSCLHLSTSTLKVAMIIDTICGLSSMRLIGPTNTRSSTREWRKSRAKRKTWSSWTDQLRWMRSRAA